MAEQVVQNAAQIAAARAQEAARINALNAAQAKAEAVKSSATKIYGSTISPVVTSLTAAIQQAQKDLLSKSGTISKSTQAAINAATAANKAIQPEIKTQLTDYTNQYTAIQNQISNLSTPVSIPTAIYAATLGTSGKEILRAKLQQLQIPDTILESSIAFVEALVNDGISQDEAVDIYYNNKNFTTKEGKTFESPFYSEFTFLRESAPKTGNPPTPLQLMQFKLGVKNLVAQYGRSELFATDESLKKYVSNDVDLVTLDKRFTEAAMKRTEANPLYVKALQDMGYISSAEGIDDFFLDPEIGKKQFELNKQTGAFAQQVLAGSSKGISFDKARITQLAAPFAAAGTAEQVAAEGYTTIGQQLQPLTKLEGIYNRQALDQTALTPEIQKQLEEEQFRGTASELRKKRIEQEQLAFQAQSGTITASRLTGGSLATGGVSGLI
jgi:hypothetical protein